MNSLKTNLYIMVHPDVLAPAVDVYLFYLGSLEQMGSWETIRFGITKLQSVNPYLVLSKFFRFMYL